MKKYQVLYILNSRLVPDSEVKRSSAQIPNDMTRVDTKIAAALAGIQPDDEYHTPTHTQAHPRIQTLQVTHKKIGRLKYAQACKN